MSVRIAALEPDMLPAVARFSEKVWRRPRTLDFLRWRYLEAPAHTAYVALSGDDCLAMLSVFSRRYRQGEASTTCQETSDWFCLPELRLSGLGIRVMRRAMDEPGSIVAVGGTADTLTLLPRLGWQRVGQATDFVRRLGRGTAGVVPAQRLGVSARLRVLRAGLASVLFGPPSVAPPAGCEAVAAPMAAPEMQALVAGPVRWSMAALPDLEQLAWLERGFAGSRRFAALCFRREGAAVGWSLLRLEGEPGLEARLLDLFSRGADPRLCAWMVAVTMRHAAAAGAAWLRARASCPILQDALRRNRFVETSRQTIHVWRPQAPSSVGPLHFCFNTGDEALLPYPGE